MPERRRHAASANTMLQVLRCLETQSFDPISAWYAAIGPHADPTEVYDRQARDDD